MRWMIVIAVLVSMVGPVSAGQDDPAVFFPEECREAGESGCANRRTVVVFGALAALECSFSSADLGPFITRLIDVARTKYGMLPYAYERCLQFGLVPKEIRDSGGVQH